MTDRHMHEWKTRYIQIHFEDYISGMECECGEILDQDEVERIVNQAEHEDV